MEAFYFGEDGKNLFGIYNEPKIGAFSDEGIIMCYPIGQEYMRTHRSFVKLSHLLSNEGFHVFRFDYFGCGDSKGDFENATVDLWINNICASIVELFEAFNLRKCYIVGNRLGATLAVFALNQIQYNIEKIVLWDPIIQGESYFKEITAQHKYWLRGSFAKNKRTRCKGIEVLGYYYNEKLINEITKLKLDISKLLAAKLKLLLIESSQKQKYIPFLTALSNEKNIITYKHFPGNEIWYKRDEDKTKSIVPMKILNYITNWFSNG